MRRLTKTSIGWSLPTILAATLVFAAASPSAAFYLPDTGQTKCYQAVDPYAEIPCAGTGQDGAYIQNPLSYTDNGSTVTDNNTGLIWQKEDDGNTYNWYQASGTYDASYNQESTDVCGSLDLGGATDWRLPSKKELISIVDYAIPYPGPAIHPVFTNTKSSGYWSSTSYANNPVAAWYVIFSNGGVYALNKSYTLYVRCVRGGQYSGPELTDNGNGTVTDSKTGLVWQQEEPGGMAWGAALSYCQDLPLANKYDWRLPNIKELKSLTDDATSVPAIDTTKFPNAITSYYWSSTSYAGNPVSAWSVDFGDGNVNAYGKYSPLYVRCVRGGQSGSLDHLWRSGETDAGNGWKWTNWFGYYNTTYFPWVYHAQHGWLYTYDDGSGGVFFWDNSMSKFWWTNSATYPSLYRFGAGESWLWYQRGSSAPRWFYNYGPGFWEAMP